MRAVKKLPPAARVPSSKMKEVLDQLLTLKDARGVTFEELEKRGGAGQQTFSKWSLGSSPQISTLEATVAALDAELLVKVLDRRAGGGAPIVAGGATPQGVEVAAVIDAIKDEAVRDRICAAVHRLANTLQGR